jgi:hypothetical protein
LVIDLANVEDFSMTIEGSPGQPSSKYVGSYEPVRRDVNLDDIYDFDGSNRNVAMPVVRGIMDEISLIFGFSTGPACWMEPESSPVSKVLRTKDV